MGFRTDKSQFTHYAKFYGVPCYFNIETSEMAGRNKFFDLLIPWVAGLHILFIAPFADYGFPIRLQGEINK